MISVAQQAMIYPHPQAPADTEFVSSLPAPEPRVSDKRQSVQSRLPLSRVGISTAILPTSGKKLLQCELFVLGSFISLAIVIEYIHGMPSFRFLAQVKSRSYE